MVPRGRGGEGRGGEGRGEDCGQVRQKELCVELCRDND